jgi:SAM-dependent methyltransferase
MFGIEKKRNLQPKIDGEIPSVFYDADYYAGNIKSNWETSYDWQNFGKMFKEWAKFIIVGFPEAKNFLDVGCARGFLEKGILDVCERSELNVEIEGFDVSPWAIENCEASVKQLVECASVDSYEFKRNFDVMISLDTFEHLTVKQSTEFLSRSRHYINDCGFFVIALDEERQRDEPSHVNLQNRAWWDAKFKECGWVSDWETQMMTILAMKEKFIKSCNVEVFIYRTRIKKLVSTLYDDRLLEFAKH